MSREVILSGIDTAQLPLFVGAGVIKSDDRIREFAQIPELAAQVIGSYSENEWGGNDPYGDKTVCYWDETNQAFYNAIGLKNEGRRSAGRYLPEAIKVVRDAGQLAVVAVTSVNGEQPRKVLPALAEWALEMGADGVELNGSCPNEGPHSVLCLDPEESQLVTETVRQAVGDEAYVLYKVSALPQETVARYQTSPLAVNAITAINNCRRLSPILPTTQQPAIEVQDGYAGQSGPIIDELAVSSLRRWHSGDPSSQSPYDVWSIGGIDSGYKIHDRVHDDSASMVGAAQALYRSLEPAALIRRWARQYTEAEQLSYPNGSW